MTGDRFIDIVFDGPPAHESGRFVEVEDPNGASVRVGEWIDRGNGLWALRITPEACELALYEMPSKKGWYLDKDGNPIHVDGSTYNRPGRHAYGAHQFRQYAPFVRLVPEGGES